MRRVSCDILGTVTNINRVNAPSENITDKYQPGQFVAAMYDQKWYIGCIKRSDEQGDVFVKFIKETHTSSNTFTWTQYKMNVGCHLNISYVLSQCHLHAEWHFFATSHGKSPCDGLGGTGKRLAARASLQAPLTGQILTSQDLYKFAENHIPGICFLYVSDEDVTTHSNDYKLAERFSTLKTVPGTRSHRSFVIEGKN